MRGGGGGGRGKGEEAMRELNLLPKSTTQGPLWGVDPRPLDRESGLVTITLACLLIPTHALKKYVDENSLIVIELCEIQT